MRFYSNGTRDVVLLRGGGDGNKRTTLEQRLWWFQRLGWLTRLLENNIFCKRTLYFWQGQRCVYRNGYFLDGEDKRIDWRLLIGKHLESGCFFKALLDKGLVEKGEQAKGGEKLKQRLTAAFFVNAPGEKVDQPIVIWKSKLPRCFKKLQDPSRPANSRFFES